MKRLRIFFIDRYYDFCSWLIREKLKTIDFISWLVANYRWSDRDWREGFYKYRAQHWKTGARRPSFQDYVRHRLFD